MPPASRLLANERVPVLPIFAAGRVEQHDRHHVALAGLQQREHLERFVERAEAAGQADDRVALLHEHQLAREEVLHVHQLGVAADDGVGDLLEGEHDVQAHRALAAGAAMAGFHDAAGAPVTTSQPLSAIARPSFSACL